MQAIGGMWVIVGLMVIGLVFLMAMFAIDVSQSGTA